MANIKPLFFILLMIAIQNGPIWMLNPTEVCNNIETECAGSYNKNNVYKIKCSKLNCTNEYNIKCNNDHCGKTVKACKDFRKIYISAFTNFEPVQFRKNLRHFKSIKKCHFQTKSVWKSSDHCLNELKCFQKNKIASRVNFITFHTQSKCQCSGKHTYECFHGNKFYCSINEKKCQRLKKIKNETKHLKHVKNCKTKATYYEKNYSLFG